MQIELIREPCLKPSDILDDGQTGRDDLRLRTNRHAASRKTTWKSKQAVTALPYIIGAVSLFIGAAPQARAAAEPDHLGLRCAGCHLAGDAVSAETASRLTTTQEALCGRCHRGAVEASHPTGFVPDRPLPAGFALDWKGEVTCSTCHEIHGNGLRILPTEQGAGDACSACHDVRFFDRMADRGMSLTRSAHLDARAHRPAQPIDAYSVRCMDCHDDKASTGAETIRAAFTASNGTGMLNHPIGFEYSRADLERRLHSPKSLPAEMLLPEGKVGCVSCHRGYSRTHGALVTLRQSDLCLACHDK